MKTVFFLTLLTTIIALSSCQKETLIDPTEGTHFMSFEFGGTPINIEADGSGSNYPTSTTSNSFVINSNDPTQFALMHLYFENDQTTKADLMRMIGQTITVGACAPNCGLHGQITYYKEGEFYAVSMKADNSSPDNYIKIQSVTYDNKLSRELGVELYIIEGTFNAQLRDTDNNFVEEAANGKFKLRFPLYN